MPAPEIAVVIATRNRETRLAFALDALAEQTLDRDRFEVIVVRDPDCRPGLAPGPEGLPVRFLFGDGAPGPTGQRNLGWRTARAPLVAFTDDDCRPEPQWLERLLAAAKRAPGAVLQGVTAPDPDEAHLLHGFARTRDVASQSAFFETCNIAYPRELLARLGGFDEDFVWGGEDTDLGLRAVAAGAGRAFVPDAVVYHAVLAIPPHRALALAGERGSEALVIARHPEQRKAIYLGLFTREVHAFVLLALTGALLSAYGRGWRRWLWVPALFPWARKRVNHTRRDPLALLAQSAHLPVRAAVDVAETIGAARAAIRHRTMVL